MSKDKKISDEELTEFIIDEHSSDAYNFIQLQKKIVRLILDSPEYKKDWIARYNNFLDEYTEVLTLQ